MVSCIDEHRDRFGVEPICKVLPIAPSTYYTHQSVQQDPERRSARAKRDDDLKREIQRVWDDNFRVYGVRKVWRQLKREGQVVARCTVARLMRDLGLRSGPRILDTSLSGISMGFRPPYSVRPGHNTHRRACVG